MSKNVKRNIKVKPVIVDWVDSVAQANWGNEDDAIACDLACVSIGDLVHKDKTALTLCLNRSAYGGGHYIKIPMRAVNKIKKLKE